jgi:hypothetical protein
MHQLSNAEHEQIEMLAYRLWVERGKPFGSPDDDWLRAEEEFRQLAGVPSRLSLSSVMMGPIE